MHIRATQEIKYTENIDHPMIVSLQKSSTASGASSTRSAVMGTERSFLFLQDWGVFLMLAKELGDSNSRSAKEGAPESCTLHHAICTHGITMHGEVAVPYHPRSAAASPRR